MLDCAQSECCVSQAIYNDDTGNKDSIFIWWYYHGRNNYTPEMLEIISAHIKLISCQKKNNESKINKPKF